MQKDSCLFLPNHIAFIIDGNRRWAKKIGKDANFGHQNGAQNIDNWGESCIFACL